MQTLSKLDETLKSLPWSDFRRQETKRGPRMVRSAQIPSGHVFWKCWKEDAGEIKSRGFTISKVDSNWQITEWKTVDGKTTEESKAIASEYKEAERAANENIHLHPAHEAILQELIAAKKLLPYQPPGVRRNVWALIHHKGALDASDTGAGKTFVALAALRVLGLRPVVICPKTQITPWARACAHMELSPVMITNWEDARIGKEVYGQWKTPIGKRKERYVWDFSMFPESNKICIVFDEVHRAKNHASQNCDMVCGAVESGYLTVALSATAASNPLEMRAVGCVTQLHNDTDFHLWKLRNGVSNGCFVGGQRALLKINRDLFPSRGNRIRIKDLGDQFPETQVASEVFSFGEDETRGMKQAYDEMFKELAQLEMKCSPFSDKLVVMLRARQSTELLKVPGLCQMAEDHIQEGGSVVIFANFKETVDAICRRMKTNCIIDGRQQGDKGLAERIANIDAFQSDKERIIVANIAAGGVGVSLHDITGKHPRLALINPSFNAIDLRQALGRVHRAGGKTKSIQKIVFAANTIEERACEKVREKLARVDQINDGELADALTF